tara:strand:+ start:266 stop:1051 length:786 start_codon:yes stop_codon:yes gene_type:complete
MKEHVPGTVYLVGSGPGDPDLLTLKANRLISQCDALVYDALVPQEVLSLAKKKCELIFVGKRRGYHSIPQTQTNALLLELARKYPNVVRLKGGDPFMFGRGGEEANFLAIHGITVEVVPGLTAGMTVPSYVGIPLTHRLAGSSVTFVTGHEGSGKCRPSVEWRKLATATNTLVIYMGVHNLSYIINELLAGGMNPKTLSVVIQQGTVIGQRCIKSTIDNIVSEVKKHQILAPSIIVIGNVINFQVESCSPGVANVTMPIER